MKPLYELAALLAAIEAGRVEFHIREERVDALIEILGDDYMTVVKSICRQLQPSDFSANWPCEHNTYEPCADVYGNMRDAWGERSEQEYAWYIKLGVRPGEKLSSKKWFLSFHPTSEIRLRDGTVLRTTVPGYGEGEDE